MTVRGDRATGDRARVEAGSRLATSIDLRARGALAPNVAELLDEAPGLHARSAGDALLPTVVSLRGAPANHVTVALDGVVLNDGGSAGVDLALVPPAMLERADVYRGGAPVRLGTAGLGGAIELITRASPPRAAAWVAAGGGSFGQRRASAAAMGAARGVRTLVAVSYRGTQGDFPFYDDRGTDLDDRDDRTSTRLNNAGDGVDAMYRACVGPDRGPACVLLLAGWRAHGLPGPGASQFVSTSLEQFRGLARGSYRLALGPAGHLDGYAAASARRDHFRDTAGAVVAGQTIDARGAGHAVEAGLTGVLAGAGARTEPVFRLRRESFAAAAAAGVAPDATRYSVLAGADLAVARAGVEGTAGLALDALDDATDDGQPGVRRVLLSPRVGARVPLGLPGLELRANAAHLERAPSLEELYGVGGYLAGNRGLVPERSDTVDAALRLRARTREWDVRIEAGGFARRANELIVLLRTGAIALRPFNLRGADVLGAEAGARVSFRRTLAVVASYAYTRATTRAPATPADGLRTPSIPEHDLYTRAEVTAGPVRATAELSWVAGVYYDETNRRAAPPRVLLGASLAVTPPFARWLTLGVAGTNLLDQRDGVVELRAGARTLEARQPVADFAGYPLPGRAVFVSLAVTTEAAP